MFQGPLCTISLSWTVDFRLIEPLRAYFDSFQSEFTGKAPCSQKADSQVQTLENQAPKRGGHGPQEWAKMSHHWWPGKLNGLQREDDIYAGHGRMVGIYQVEK